FDKSLFLWDVTTGTEIHSLPDPVAYLKNYRTEQDGLRLVFSADGNMVALLPPFQRPYYPEPHQPVLQENNALCLWNVASRKPPFRFEPNNNVMINGAFSPDGRLLATGNDDNTISFWETATGKESFRTEAVPAGATLALAFSTDGRLLASAGRENTIRLWNVSIGKELGKLAGHRGGILALTFSADGRTLVAGGTDGTVLLHDLSRVNVPRPSRNDLPAAQAKAFWDDLGKSDARKAHQAICTLSAVPDQAIALIQESLTPAPGPEEKYIRQLVADLDSPQFAVREKA